MKKLKKPNLDISLKGFTLVELIVVIVILSILATIAFLSFSSQSSSARDSTRLSDISNIIKGLELYNVGAGYFPMPENITGTGIINGEVLSYVGAIKDPTSRLININKTPTDPLGQNYYSYGVSYDKKYYQIGAVLENSIAFNDNVLIPTANAAVVFQTKVTGNYGGLIKKNKIVYNIPSLIFTGSGELTSMVTYYVADKSANIPYKPNTSYPDNTQTPAQILNLIGNTATTVTGVTIKNWNTQSGVIASNLGFTEDLIGTTYYGNTKYYNEVKIGNYVEAFPTTCNYTDSPITYAQAVANQAVIYAGASTSYKGCRISDYQGGANAIIAGTSTGSKVLVAYPTDESSTRIWGCYGSSLLGIKDNFVDGIYNTDGIMSLCAERPIAFSVCRDRGSNWYLPATDELSLFYTNLKVAGISSFLNGFYWSSAERNVYYSYYRDFNNNNSNTREKYNAYYVRCASRF